VWKKINLSVVSGIPHMGVLHMGVKSLGEKWSTPFSVARVSVTGAPKSASPGESESCKKIPPPLTVPQNYVTRPHQLE
jgi:hypothetical protein